MEPSSTQYQQQQNDRETNVSSLSPPSESLDVDYIDDSTNAAHSVTVTTVVVDGNVSTTPAITEGFAATVDESTVVATINEKETTVNAPTSIATDEKEMIVTVTAAVAVEKNVASSVAVATDEKKATNQSTEDNGNRINNKNEIIINVTSNNQTNGSKENKIMNKKFQKLQKNKTIITTVSRMSRRHDSS